MGPHVTAAVAALALAAAVALGAPATRSSRDHLTHAAPSSAPSSGASSAPSSEPEAAWSGYAWPTGSPAEVVRDFHRPPVAWARGHRGVDLRMSPDTAVLAPADGVVTFAGAVAGRPVMSVAHAGGIRTTYEPVDARLHRGDRVRTGDILGWLSTTKAHCAPMACLHWGARRSREDYLDPLTLLARPVVIRLYAEQLDGQARG